MHRAQLAERGSADPAWHATASAASCSPDPARSCGSQGDFDSPVLRMHYCSLKSPDQTLDFNMATGARCGHIGVIQQASPALGLDLSAWQLWLGLGLDSKLHSAPAALFFRAHPASCPAHFTALQGREEGSAGAGRL